MAKLACLALLAGLGLWAWQHGLLPVPAALAGPSPAFETYERFATYLAHDQYGNARELASRAAIRSVQIRELRGKRNTRLGIASTPRSADERETLAQGDVLRVSHEPISETVSQDGATVTIEAVEHACRRQGACQDTRQDVEVCLSEDQWKVCSFYESS